MEPVAERSRNVALFLSYNRTFDAIFLAGLLLLVTRPSLLARHMWAMPALIAGCCCSMLSHQARANCARFRSGRPLFPPLV